MSEDMGLLVFWMLLVIWMGVKNLSKEDKQSESKDLIDDGSLSYKVSKHIHDTCKDVPHDIGLQIMNIVKTHLNDIVK